MRNETDGGPVLVWEYGRRTEDEPLLVCTECGLVVHPNYTGVHHKWHRDLEGAA